MKRILLSNSGLPSTKIGSWTNRFSIFLKTYPLVFDLIISPTEFPDSRFLHAHKRKYSKMGLKKFFIKNVSQWVYQPYISILSRISLTNKDLHVLVIDDLLLLECISYWKKSNRHIKIRLDFSFHGHSFILPDSWGNEIDNVFFLTRLGYLETLVRNEIFTPKVNIIANGSDSNLFFSLDEASKIEKKVNLGYDKDDLLLLWVSNDRPKKGLKLFFDIGKILVAKYNNLKILLIGAPSDLQLPGPEWRNLGKMSNSDLPEFLQIGDFYFFTSLWKEGFGLSLIEAAKCGNILIASNNGGIPEVLAPLKQKVLINHPNIVDDWIEGFEEALKYKSQFKPNNDELEKYFSLESWMSNLLKALN